MAIDATVGGADSNSLVDMAEADAYFASRINADAWTDAGDTREAALVTAAYRLEQEHWRGRKADSDQALAWPRYGLTDEDGRTVASDAIPVRVKRAQMELALALLNDDELLDDTGMEGFRAVTIGPLDVETRIRSAGSLPANVARDIAPFLATGGASIRLERA